MPLSSRAAGASSQGFAAKSLVIAVRTAVALSVTTFVLAGSAASATTSAQPLPAAFVVDESVRLTATAGDLPLGFYPQVVGGSDGEFYLSGIAGGIYPPSKYSIYRFDSGGRFVGGRGSPDGGSPWKVFLLGMREGKLLAISRFLSAESAEGGSWLLYSFAPDLTLDSARAGMTPGTLAGDEILAPGVGAPMATVGSSGEVRYCLHAYSLEGSYRRSFGECPPDPDHVQLQIVELGVDDATVYWMHFLVPRIHACSVAGEDLGSFGNTPARFVSWQEANREPAAPPAGAPLAEAKLGLAAVMQRLTPIERIAVTGTTLVASFRRPDPRPRKWWYTGSIVQVYDLHSRALMAEFETPLRLLGIDDRGTIYWLRGRGRASRPKFDVLKTRIADGRLVAPASGRQSALALP